ncbi:MAG: hypothetical protein FJ279_05970 [Planctomycetes bacterium]|nr:hypothetical protein [Planctomycetota bacterium]MBM4083949.1 hypothetical protein [Planctomycetota bacterium]
MRSKTTARFRKAFAELPEQVQDKARKSYRQFRQDPWHPSLRFKQVHPTIPIYSARVSRGYRAVGQRTEDKVVWFWIGTHADYEKLLSQLGYSA